MPYSDPSLKPWSLDFYRSIRPASVVDVGPGAGTYAQMFRPYHQSDWTAVEMWGPYVEQFGLDRIYDQVIIGDVRHLNPELFMSDLVIFGDVLEHMPKGDALDVLYRASLRAENIVVSLPIGDWPQGAVDGVPTEVHVSTWEDGDVLKLLDGCEMRIENNVAVYHWGA